MSKDDILIKEIQILEKGDAVVSPEGADEVIHKVESFMITQTANGR